jgi:BCD family chlorophyll transporter-like MFS transporter
MALLSFLMYGFGTLISGAPYLALVHDSAPYERRGQVIGIVQFMLVVSFAFIPAIYALLMPVYDPQLYLRLVIFAMLGAAIFWFISVRGEEQRTIPRQARVESSAGFGEIFLRILSDRRTRNYAIFLGASALFAFMQDAILEPFGGDVFGLEAGETTRFNAYWGIGVLVAMVISIYLTRKRRPEDQVSLTAWGLLVMGATMIFLALTSWFLSLLWVLPVLIAFGLGFGVFTVGGVSLLMAMNEEKLAATYLALWTVIQLISRGVGIALGGVLRDIFLTITGNLSQAYAGVFMIEALGLMFCIYLLSRVDVRSFAEERAASPTGLETLTAAAD